MIGDLDPRRPAAILYRTHFWTAALEAELLKLAEAVGDRYDIWVIGYAEAGVDFAVPPPARKILFNQRHLRALGLPASCPCHPAPIPPRNLDWALLQFYRMIPEYQHYWMIEYDVRYSGNWDHLLQELDDPAVDLLATVIQRRSEHPGWSHWYSLCTLPVDGLPQHHDRQVKAFAPMMRLTQRAFAAVDAAYRRGWHGHYEALWPTVIEAAGMRIEDIGGSGSFTPAARVGRHYTSTAGSSSLWPGSFIFRPAIPESEMKNAIPLLWHPVKPAETPPWVAGAAPINRE
jgi:hypothetical protein